MQNEPFLIKHQSHKYWQLLVIRRSDLPQNMSENRDEGTLTPTRTVTEGFNPRKVSTST